VGIGRLATLAVLVIALGGISGCDAAPAEAIAPNGLWLTASGNFEIELAACGQALCGKVTKVLANRSMAGSGSSAPPGDARSLLGMQILIDMKPTANGAFRGSIYNRENGKTYDCEIRSLSADRLKVRAYKLIPLFGKTQIWTRVGP
jgi:uncharacterized protein (DUF2147 family)